MTDTSVFMPLTIVKKLVFVLFTLTLVTVVGCGGDDDAEKDAEKALNTAGPDGGRARLNNLERDYAVEPIDLNKDGKPDQWTYKDAAEVKRYERDMNFDGKVDVWQYPDKTGKNVGEEEMDLDLDGRVDVVVFYEEGVIMRKMMSVDFTGKFTITKFYNKKGELLRVERDEDVDGTPEVFEYYEGNRRVRIGWDEDGDGAPDKFDTLE